jgi:hypothetical protein
MSRAKKQNNTVGHYTYDHIVTSLSLVCFCHRG